MNINSLILHPKRKDGTQFKPLVIHQFHLQRAAARYGSGYFSGLELLAEVSYGKTSSDTASDTTDSFSCTSPVGKKVDDLDYDDPNVKPKRKRANARQLETLKQTFQQTPFPTSECRRKLAKQLGMTPRSVQIWFQNQRQLARNLVPVQPPIDLD